MTLENLGFTPFFKKQIDNRSFEKGEENLSTARVVGVRKNSFIVRDGVDEKSVTAAGALIYASETGGLFPVTGDWVLVDESRIVSVFLRANELSRGAPGARGSGHEGAVKGQVLAANIDTVFIVCGLDRDYNPRRIERYVTLVYNCGAEPVVILTKSDLHESPEDFASEIEDLMFGLPVHLVSSPEGRGTESLEQYLRPGRTVAMLGSSGAGKSSLLNRLAGKEVRRVGEVSERDGKGMHTTTTRDLFFLPGGGMIIDNPGIREIAFWDDAGGIDETFPDIMSLGEKCRFSDCTHFHEPGCAVISAMNEGDLSSERLESYRKMRREFDYLALRDSKSADRVEKERWRDISLLLKRHKKRKK